MGIYITILEQGLIYGILALGVYITYKILDFPDLTVDGSFPLGAATDCNNDHERCEPVSHTSGIISDRCSCRDLYRSDPCEM